MVGTLKRWLKITELESSCSQLERENLRLARAILAMDKRVDELEAKLAAQVAPENKLTPEPAKPKIAPRPQVVKWKRFRSAAEAASEPKEQE